MAKKIHCNYLTVNSKNKTQTTWSNTKTVSSNITNTKNISKTNVNNNLTNDSQTIANAFNEYFLTAVDVITDNLLNKSNY